MSFFLNGNCHFVPGPTSTTLASASASFSRLSRRGRLELSTSSTMFCERAADELVAVPGACLSIFSHPIDAATFGRNASPQTSQSGCGRLTAAPSTLSAREDVMPPAVRAAVAPPENGAAAAVGTPTANARRSRTGRELAARRRNGNPLAAGLRSAIDSRALQGLRSFSAFCSLSLPLDASYAPGPVAKPLSVGDEIGHRNSAKVPARNVGTSATQWRGDAYLPARGAKFESHVPRAARIK